MVDVVGCGVTRGVVEGAALGREEDVVARCCQAVRYGSHRLCQWRGQVGSPYGRYFVVECLIKPGCEFLRIASGVDEEALRRLPSEQRENQRLRGAAELQEARQSYAERVPGSKLAHGCRDVLHDGVKRGAREWSRDRVEGAVSRE